LQALEKLGWKEGRNLHIDYRWAAADPDRARAYATELIGLSPEAILVVSPMVTAAIRQQTNTIPIVFLGVGDPVQAGFVESLARPGGNVTGFTNFEDSLGGKWLDLLKQIAPRVTRVMIIYDPRNVTGIGYLRASEAAAQAVSVQLSPAPVREATEIEQAINQFAREPNGGLIVLPSPFAADHREQIVILAALNHLPAIYPYRHFVAPGGLLSFGPDLVDEFRRSASYIDRILRGASPAELPVQAMDKYELVINLKTARALGLEVPLHLQQLADEVIE
jgi:putative ABC transport system substrate-binding protein